MTALPSLASVLQNPAIWRGGDCAQEPAAIASGFPPLDAVLPGGGWPTGALTEIMLAREGIGEVMLTLPALKRLQAARRDIVWIAPPHVPYAPALAAAGLDLTRLIIVRCAAAADQLWAYEQALRAPECGAAFAWLGTADDRVLRRLQVAAREGHTWGMLWRRPGQHALAAAAPLRLALAPHHTQLAIRVLKRRGGEVVHPILIDINAASTGALPLPMPISSMPSSPSDCRTFPSPDPRTSAGRFSA